MPNQVLLEILRKIQADTPQAFSDPKQVASILKESTNNDAQYNAVIRWIEISLADFDAFARIKDDYQKNHDFARTRIYDSLISEGVSADIAKEVIGYWAALAGFAENQLEPKNSELVKKAEQGDAESQCELGWCYSSGEEEGYVVNYETAIGWLTKALNNPNAKIEDKARAAYYMARMYYDSGSGDALGRVDNRFTPTNKTSNLYGGKI